MNPVAWAVAHFPGRFAACEFFVVTETNLCISVSPLQNEIIFFHMNASECQMQWKHQYAGILISCVSRGIWWTTEMDGSWSRWPLT